MQYMQISFSLFHFRISFNLLSSKYVLILPAVKYILYLLYFKLKYSVHFQSFEP